MIIGQKVVQTGKVIVHSSSCIIVEKIFYVGSIVFIDQIIHQSLSPANQNTASRTLAFGLSNAVRFKIDNVIFYLHTEWELGKYAEEVQSIRYKVEDRIPNVAPLAPLSWFEYCGDAVGLSPHYHYGCLVSVEYDSKKPENSLEIYTDADFDENVRWTIAAETFVMGDDCIRIGDWIYRFRLDKNGAILSHFSSQSTRCTDITGHSRIPYLPYEKTWKAEVVGSLLATCFSHCKGTVVEEHKPTRQVRRAAERKKEPVYSYHTIDVRPTAQVLRNRVEKPNRGSDEEKDIIKALHIVRGHFAAYTEEHPLFGKYVGTVYRPMHTRGDLKNGVVEKKYQVFT